MAAITRYRMSPAGRAQAEADSLKAARADSARKADIDARAAAARQAAFNAQATARSRTQNKKKKPALWNPFDAIVRALGGQ